MAVCQFALTMAVCQFAAYPRRRARRAIQPFQVRTRRTPTWTCQLYFFLFSSFNPLLRFARSLGSAQ